MKLDKNLPSRLIDFLSNDNVAIFLFHGVIKKQVDSVRNYTGKHIEADLFSSCMKGLAKKGYPLSMDEVIFHHQNKIPFPPKSFVITFDDGFENNLSVAAPILIDYKIPATIYLTSLFVDENKMSWIDRIELIIEHLPSSNLSFDWTSEIFYIDGRKSRINFLRKVRSYVKNTKKCDPNKFTDDLSIALGKTCVYSSNDQLNLKMSWNQVKKANQNELLTFGGHSHSHPILSYLEPNQLEYELKTSLKMLLDKANIPPTHYSYPEGMSNCFNQDVINKLKNKNVKCCPTAINGVNQIETNLFLLKRIMVNNE